MTTTPLEEPLAGQHVTNVSEVFSLPVAPLFSPSAAQHVRRSGHCRWRAVQSVIATSLEVDVGVTARAQTRALARTGSAMTSGTPMRLASSAARVSNSVP